ncbi:glycoside hydrolase family 172 protein [Pseudalkalibacillus sp. R45]|uniref:glycoside hydrolase family 172 protein n=1 Tax=Pseudalkalibacillus sp. R45 TaxID=3457433 RepID=UPI003FCE63E8
MSMGYSSLADLARIRDCKRKRISSYDPEGGNYDWIELAGSEQRTIANLSGAGCIRHIWCTMFPPSGEENSLRKVLIRMYWDGEDHPSVEVPIGDFFGMGHGISKNFWSLPLSMSPDQGRGFNCYFAMPYSDGGKIEIVNEGDTQLNYYFYIDYEEYEQLGDDIGRFHAQWRREEATDTWGAEMPLNEPLGATAEGQRYLMDVLWKKPNFDGKDNYVILEAEGKGHYIGCNLNIDCFVQEKNNWYGEGDDMIFIDGETIPSIHGTGTEDYFNTAFCPKDEFCTPYHGIHLNSGDGDNPWRGKNSMYRFHIEDPIHFKKSIRVTIEHGHANKLQADYSSTAYWYQLEPHKKFPPMLSVEKRLPRKYEKRTYLEPLDLENT